MTEPHRSISAMLIVLFIAVALAAVALTAAAPLPQTAIPTSVYVVEEDCTPHTEWAEYTLQHGETIESLARQLGISVEMLSEANCASLETLTTVSTLYVPAFPAS
jgi:hypothetical protein